MSEKTFAQIVAEQNVELTETETDAASVFLDTAPTSAVEIEGFVGDTAPEMVPFVFSSGNKGWRIDCKGKLHGAQVRIQANVVIAKSPAERKKARDSKKVAKGGKKGEMSEAGTKRLNQLLADGCDLNTALKAVAMLGL